MNDQLAEGLTLEAGERYRMLVEAIVDYAVYMLAPDGTIVSWNPGAQRFKGYSASEIIGEHFSAFYTDSDRKEGLPARGLHIAATKGAFETEGWRVRKDGSKFWAHVVIDPIRSVEGKLLGYAKVTRDLTEKKQAEEALHQSQEQLRLLIEGVTDYAIYLLSSEGVVTNWNSGAQRIKGYLPSEIIGRNFSCFYTSEDQAAGKPRRNLELAARDGRLEEEGWRVRKDGTVFMAHVVIDTIRGADGTITGFAKVTRDITERYEAQKTLMRTREELFHSQKMEAVGRLTGGVAHDFNNLLTIISTSLALARRRLDDPKILRLIDNAIQGAERGASMTQRMLAFSRRQSLQLEIISVSELVANMRPFLEQSVGPEVTIDTEFPLGLPCISADANQLEAILLNLVLNANDAMPAGGVIQISGWVSADKDAVSDEGESRPRLVLEVRDSGAGMDAETLARAVEPFFTTKEVGKGTGLGLAMAHGIVEQLGGKLKLYSVEGDGTAVQLWLPIAEAITSTPRSC